MSSILIVSASAGTGHLRAADAVAAALAERHPHLHREHVDLLTLAPRWVRAVYGTGYEMVAARAPGLWGGIYRATDGVDADAARWGPAAERTLFRAFAGLLRARRWSACLCTHFLPAQLAAGRPGLPPFALAVTDFTLHRVWAQRGVGQYFVATETLARQLSARVPGVQGRCAGATRAPGGVSRRCARGRGCGWKDTWTGSRSGCAARTSVSRAFAEPGLLDRLAAAARRIGRPEAAAQVADAMAAAAVPAAAPAFHRVAA